MKKILSTLFIMLGLFSILLLPTPAAADTGAAEDTPIYHTVVKGDTLWDISEMYFNDPFTWPDLWKKNPDIQNPHLIYPGDILKITPNGIEVVRLIPEPEVEEEAPYVPPTSTRAIPKPEPLTVIEETPVAKKEIKFLAISQMARSGFIANGDAGSLGVILKGTGDMKTFLHTGDLAYLSLENPDDVYVGDIYSIFTEGEVLRHPDTKQRLGRSIEYAGHLEIVSTNNIITARIQTSYVEILAGMHVTPFKEPIKSIEYTEAIADVTGVIISAIGIAKDIGEDQLFYIDKGSNDMLELGNVMESYRYPPDIHNPLGSGMIKLPPLMLGHILLIDIRENHSIGIVLKSRQALKRGDHIRTVPATIVD